MTTADNLPMNRRHYLSIGGTAVALGLAGCSMPGSSEREGVILTHVELGNASSEPEVFAILVTYDGDIVHWEPHKVGIGADEDEIGGELIEIDSPGDPGRVEVFVRVREHWERTDFDTDRYDGKRVIAVVTYGLPEAEVLRISRVVSDRQSNATE